MKIGIVGLGKLGLPVALAIEKKGHDVVGFDINPAIKSYINDKKIPYKEAHVPEFIQNTNLKLVELDSLVKHSDIIFVAVQTPHEKEFEGINRIPTNREDFNYLMLINAISSLNESIVKQSDRKIVSIISTVLPGTVETHIKDKLSEKIDLIYNPFFIAMGNTINDFYNPEFVLLGTDSGHHVANVLKEFYSTIHKSNVFHTTIKNAEFIKVAYNTFIGMKIAYANTIMEICHKIGADCDQVIDGISLASERLISSKYLRGGMGDGGGCHPRDNIAMSWLAKKINLSHDFFEDIMIAREDQTEWLANLCLEHKLPICLLGKSFKPETNIVTGSPALLLNNLLIEKGIPTIHIDPYTDEDFQAEFCKIQVPTVFFIATKHELFKELKFPKNSIILDPFRYLNISQDCVNYIPIGKPCQA